MKKKKNIIILGVILGIILISWGIYALVNKKSLDKVNDELSYLYKDADTKVVEDIYSEQEKIESEIDTQKTNKNNTIDNPYIIKNPYKIAPLSALIIFNTKSEESVTVSINNNKYNFEKGKEHVIPVYGLIAGKNNEIKITCGNDSKVVNIDTSDVEKVDYNITVGKNYDIGDNFYLVGTPTEDGLYGFNTNGDLIWRLTENFGQAIVKLENNHLLLSNKNYILDASRTGLIEIDFMGKIYNVYDIEGGYHSDAYLKDDNHVIIGSSKLNRNTFNDLVVELDLDSGKIVKKWDIKNIVNSISNSFVESLKNDNWANVNSIYYDKKTNSLILSLEGRNSVISIDYDSSKVNWIFGNLKYWNNDFINFLLKFDGEYPLLSNTVTINSEGNLVLFNNNMDGSLNRDSLCSDYLNRKSSGQIYKINDKTITLVNEFKDDFYSYAVSNYNELDNGNYLLFSAWQFKDGTMREPGCTMNTNVDGLTSSLYELDKNNNILFKATFLGGSYRAKKMQFYEKNNQNYDYEKLSFYTTMANKMYDEINIKDIIEKVKNAKDMDFSVSVSKKILTINAVFQQNDKVELIMVGKDGKAYKYLAKDKDGYLQPTINLQKLKGKYALILVINDEYFNLNKNYEF